MNAGLSYHHNTSIVQRERSMPVLPWKACNLTQNETSPLFFYIVASFLVSIGHIYVFLFSLLFSPFVRSSVGNTGRKLSLPSLSLYFSLCSIQYLGDMGSWKKKNSTKSSISSSKIQLCAEYFLKISSFSSLFSVVFISVFLVPRRDRDREISSSSFSLSFSVHIIWLPPHGTKRKKERTGDEPAKEQQQT